MSQQPFDAIQNREKGLHRGLSSGQLTMLAIGGAIGTGLFLGSSFAIGFAGPSVILSYAIGALIALMLMRCLAEMTVAHPTSGSFGAWAEFYVSPLAGYLVRYAYWSCIVFAVGTEVTAIAVYMRFWFPGTPGWLWILGFSAVLIGVNARNVKIFGAVEYAFSSLKVTAILLFILLGAITVSGTGLANYTAYGGFFPKGVWGMWVAVIVSIFSYLSIEMIAVAAGEAEDPQRAITKAFQSTVARLVIFYLLTLAIILAIVPWPDSGKGESPFVTVMARSHVPYAAAVVNFVILVAALSAMNSQLFITTRMMFSLARAGQAPSRFGQLSSNGTPVSALLLSSVGIALASLLNALYPETAFTLMMAISMFGAMFTWLMIFVTHVCFRRYHHRTSPWTSPFGALLMAAILLTTAFTAEFRMTLAYGLPTLALLTLIWKLRPKILP
ncbi:MAG: amino acid permease [Acidobacteriia bacterium]|nr:amino acid permease [Terriglobia bacterium]